MPDAARVALVTGANRGIGLEVCRQLGGRGYVVILGARDEQKGRDAAEPLRGAGIDVHVQRLDVADDRSVKEAAAAVERSVGRLDVLVNNAGILYDTWQQAAGADLAVVREAFETNTAGSSTSPAAPGRSRPWTAIRPRTRCRRPR
jgi:NAD(P)-dependent dehydrogenase (short-subunit alcohol dehydrogenase family)